MSEVSKMEASPGKHTHFPRSVRAVVFDLDGLMFNTEHIFNDVGNQILVRRGKTMTAELMGRMMGRRAPEAMACMIEYHGLADSVETLGAEAKSLFLSQLPEKLAPMPGLFELLAHIETCCLPKVVATSSARQFLEFLLNRYDLLSRFQFTLSAEDVTHGKPHPEIYLTAAKRLDIDPSEMLVLEDSHAGTCAGVEAGAVVISLPHEHNRHQDFSRAAHVASRLDDPRILQLVERGY